MSLLLDAMFADASPVLGGFSAQLHPDGPQYDVRVIDEGLGLTLLVTYDTCADGRWETHEADLSGRDYDRLMQRAREVVG